MDNQPIFDAEVCAAMENELPPPSSVSLEARHTKTALEKATEDPEVVDFEENDPENPLNWPKWRKWAIVVLVATMYMLANFGTIIIVPAVPRILREFDIDSGSIYSTILVSVWELGEGIGPFFVGPLSEIYGRGPVYHAGNVLSILCAVAAALSTNISMLTAFRFLNGFTMTSLTLGPSIVGDVFAADERGTAMAVAIAFPLLGPFAAPAVGGFVAQAAGWRWTVWLVAIAVGGLTGLSLLLFRETYKATILQRRAARLRASTGNPLLRSKYDEQPAGTFAFAQKMVRPMRILFCSPIVFLISLYTALTYGLSYLILTTLTEVMQKTYGLSEGQVGLTFLGRAVGNVLGMLLYGLTSDRYVKHKRATEGIAKPEHRLPLMVLGSLALPAGLLLYGWTAARHAYWLAPLVGTAVVGFSMLLTILPTENYLVDVYDRSGHTASAVAAGVILRALFGGVFPLLGPPLYARLGIGWGNSLLAFVAVAFIPPLAGLWLFGEKIRGRSAELRSVEGAAKALEKV